MNSIRLATNEDSEAVIALVDRVFQEYGDRVFLSGADRDLMDLQRHYFDKGGAFWVLEREDRIVGSHAAVPSRESGIVCNFRRLYLDAAFRGGEHGRELMQVTLDWAVSKGFHRVEFWSDSRFERAHRFFRRFGFETDGQTREMEDGFSPYREYFFALDL